MESRSFIKHAAVLSNKIKSLIPANYSDLELNVLKAEAQKEVNQLFSGLQNPTLPSAYKLRDAAVEKGLIVEPKIHHRLQQAEVMWSGN